MLAAPLRFPLIHLKRFIRSFGPIMHLIPLSNSISRNRPRSIDVAKIRRWSRSVRPFSDQIWQYASLLAKAWLWQSPVTTGLCQREGRLNRNKINWFSFPSIYLSFSFPLFTCYFLFCPLTNRFSFPFWTDRLPFWSWTGTFPNSTVLNFPFRTDGSFADATQFLCILDLINFLCSRELTDISRSAKWTGGTWRWSWRSRCSSWRTRASPRHPSGKPGTCLFLNNEENKSNSLFCWGLTLDN